MLKLEAIRLRDIFHLALHQECWEVKQRYFLAEASYYLFCRQMENYYVTQTEIDSQEQGIEYLWHELAQLHIAASIEETRQHKGYEGERTGSETMGGNTGKTTE